MKQVIVAVKDRAAETFGRPMFVPAIGVALRSFSDEINRNDPNNQLYNHPDDFDIYELGSFDDSTAEFQIKNNPELLILGKNARTTT